MDISNSFSSPVTSGISNKATAPIKNSDHTAEPVSQVEQDKAASKQAQPSIVIDEQAIALFKESEASQSTQTQPNKEHSSSANQDQPSAKNETAVASYQAVGNLAQRESVQQLFGVDLFA